MKDLNILLRKKFGSRPQSRLSSCSNSDNTSPIPKALNSSLGATKTTPLTRSSKSPLTRSSKSPEITPQGAHRLGNGNNADREAIQKLTDNLRTLSQRNKNLNPTKQENDGTTVREDSSVFYNNLDDGHETGVHPVVEACPRNCQGNKQSGIFTLPPSQKISNNKVFLGLFLFYYKNAVNILL